jgi:6,7-dimethyl-8-ribityllumazine synthase
VNESLAAAGVKQSNVFVTYVPGAFELPVTAKFLAMSKRVDVIVCLGCLIKGDTMHFEYIASATANGIMQVSLDSLVPCLFGVLTVLDKQQAIDRAFGPKNEGLHWGNSAVEMALNRLSALGMGKPVGKGPAESNDFVAFKNGTLPTSPDADKEKKRVFF